jgi:hypothetical protein
MRIKMLFVEGARSNVTEIPWSVPAGCPSIVIVAVLLSGVALTMTLLSVVDTVAR